MQAITNFIDSISREGDNVHLVLSATKYLNPRYWANSFQISSQFWSFQNGFNVKLNLHLASGTLKRLHNDPKSVEHLIALLACLEFQCKERKKCAIELDQMYTYFVELSCPLLRFHSETLLATPIFLSWLETISWSAKVVAIVIENGRKIQNASTFVLPFKINDSREPSTQDQSSQWERRRDDHRMIVVSIFRKIYCFSTSIDVTVRKVEVQIIKENNSQSKP